MEKVYSLFRNARIRKELGSRAEFKYIWDCYRVWAEENSLLQKLTKEHLKEFIGNEMGVPEDDGFYYGIRIFVDDKELEEWLKI